MLKCLPHPKQSSVSISKLRPRSSLAVPSHQLRSTSETQGDTSLSHTAVTPLLPNDQQKFQGSSKILQGQPPHCLPSKTSGNNVLNSSKFAT